MTKLVCISDRTPESNSREVGDIVSVHEDKAQLEKNPAYDIFDIVYVKGTKAEVQEKLHALRIQSMPPIKTIYLSKKTGQWTLTPINDDDLEDEDLIWQNPTDLKHYLYRKKRKHHFSLKDLNLSEKTELVNVSPVELSATKDTIYEKMMVQDITVFPENYETEIKVK